MFRVSSFGALVEYGCEKKITQFSNLSASVAVGVPSGVMLKLRLFHIVFIAVTAPRGPCGSPGLTFSMKKRARPNTWWAEPPYL